MTKSVASAVYVGECIGLENTCCKQEGAKKAGRFHGAPITFGSGLPDLVYAMLFPPVRRLCLQAIPIAEIKAMKASMRMHNQSYR